MPEDSHIKVLYVDEPMLRSFFSRVGNDARRGMVSGPNDLKIQDYVALPYEEPVSLNGIHVMSDGDDPNASR